MDRSGTLHKIAVGKSSLFANACIVVLIYVLHNIPTFLFWKRGRSRFKICNKNFNCVFFLSLDESQEMHPSNT